MTGEVPVALSYSLWSFGGGARALEPGGPVGHVAVSSLEHVGELEAGLARAVPGVDDQHPGIPGRFTDDRGGAVGLDEPRLERPRRARTRRRARPAFTGFRHRPRRVQQALAA